MRLRPRNKQQHHWVKTLVAGSLFLGAYLYGAHHLKVSWEQSVAKAEEPVKTQVQVLSAENGRLQGDISQMKIEYRAAVAKRDTSDLSDDQVRAMVVQLFPPQAVDRFMKILSCENHEHSALRVHKNDNGSYDLGISQINSSAHHARVEKMFGESFDSAMSDPFKNIAYAAFLYQHSGFGPWVCNGIIGKEEND